VNFDEKLPPAQTLAGTVRLDAHTTKNDEGGPGSPSASRMVQDRY
jgi:hypothetical protein